MLTLAVAELNSGSSECRRREPKCWLKFEDVVHCRDVESFNAFVEQFLAERGLVGESLKRTHWALFYAWKNGICPGAHACSEIGLKWFLFALHDLGTALGFVSVLDLFGYFVFLEH